MVATSAEGHFGSIMILNEATQKDFLIILALTSSFCNL